MNIFLIITSLSELSGIYSISIYRKHPLRTQTFQTYAKYDERRDIFYLPEGHIYVYIVIKDNITALKTVKYVF